MFTPEDSSEVRQAIADIIAEDERGCCIRVDAEDITLATPQAVAADLNTLLSDVGSTVPSADLVIDVGLVRSTVVARVVTAEAGFRVIPCLRDWRNVVCAFSAFPESIGDSVATGTVGTIPREDAIAFRTLVARNDDLDIIYGDYAVGTPFYADIPWAPVPAIRYTYNDQWYVHRGMTKDNRSAQYVQLSTDLSVAPYFSGRGFSAGDSYLADVASGVDGPGNPMTYVRVATSQGEVKVPDALH